jgi:hypothetical protein
MPEKKTSRKLALAAGLVAAFGLTMAASAPQPAEAVAAAQDCYYFSDSSHTQPVGARGKDCCGRSIDWGTTSPYFYCEPVPVCVWCPPDSEVI